MNEHRPPSDNDLRHRAEQLLHNGHEHSSSPLPEEVYGILHELQVHQIELELQNEELRRTQEALNQGRMRYMQLFQQAPVGYVVLDQAGLISEVNNTFCHLVRLERARLLGRPFADCIHSEDRPVYWARARVLFKHPANKELELRLSVDGALPCHVNLRATDAQELPLYKSNKGGQLLLVVTDITFRVQAEALLRESELMARATLDSLSAHIAILDQQGSILAVNRAWREFALANQADPATVGEGTNYLHLCLSAQGEGAMEARAFAAGIQAVLNSEMESHTQEYSCHSPGENRWFLGRVTRFPSQAGRKVVVSHENITERKQYEQQLLAINTQLELRVEQRTQELQSTQRQYLHAEKLTAIGKLSASIAHEFNNPLQGILSILKGVLKRAILVPEDRELLEAAIGEVDRIRDLIRTLQEFNRPSSGRKVLFNVHTSLDSILLLHTSDFRKRQIRIVREYAPELPTLLAVPDQIKQVFLNLLANSADACSNSGGVITLRTWHEEEEVVVAIEDTGVGIAEEHLERIFEPFFTTKQEMKGTGLGLSASYGIITGHNGSISVASQPGEGTTFMIRLPIA